MVTAAAQVAAAVAERCAIEGLTAREREVLRRLMDGLARAEIAERLVISPHTVRTHVQRILGKLGVRSSLAAVALARRAGF